MFNVTYYGLDQLVHSIFVIKIWTVALKICEIKKGNSDKWLGFKVWSVAIFQFSLIISIQIASWLVSSDKKIYLIYLCSPFLTVLVLLIVSFCILKGLENNEASLSNINIGVQIFAYALYATSNLIFLVY